MVQVKSNLAPTGSAILFEVAEKGVDFISEMEMTAEEAFQSLAPKMGRPNDKEIKAKEFLLEFLYEEELRSKNARLVELDTLLNIDGKGHAQPETVVAKSARPSVLDSLKRPATPRSTDKKPKQHEEVR